MSEVHIPYVKLIAYAARELDYAESVSVAAHTTACAECKATVIRFRAVKSVMFADPIWEPPVTTVARAQAILSQRNTIAFPASPRLTLPPFLQLARRFSFAAVMAGVLLVLVLLFGQVGPAAAATRDSLPGDTLYPVKLTIESLQLGIMLDPVNKAELHLIVAETRVQEIQALTTKGKGENIPATAQAYASQVDEAGKLLVIAQKQNESISIAVGQMEQVVTRSADTLTSVTAMVPDASKPEITNAIHASQRAAADAATLQTTFPSASPTPTNPAMILTTPTLPARSNTPPGQPKTPPGQVNTPSGPNTPTGDQNTPPGQQTTPPARENTPAAQENTPTVQQNTPTVQSTPTSDQTTPSAQNTPPGQVNTPPGQQNTPPGQQNNPPGQQNNPPGQQNNPPGQQNNPPGQQNNPPGQQKNPPGQQKTPPGKSK